MDNAQPASSQGCQGDGSGDVFGLRNLSVSELKQQFSLADVPIPAGLLEKNDLVIFLEEVLHSSAETNATWKLNAKRMLTTSRNTATFAAQNTAAIGSHLLQNPAPVKEGEDSAAEERQKELFELYRYSVEDLHRLVKKDGVSLPAGDLSKHYIVAALLKARREKQIASKRLETRQAPPMSPACALAALTKLKTDFNSEKKLPPHPLGQSEKQDHSCGIELAKDITSRSHNDFFCKKTRKTLAQTPATVQLVDSHNLIAVDDGDPVVVVPSPTVDVDITCDGAMLRRKKKHRMSAVVDNSKCFRVRSEVVRVTIDDEISLMSPPKASGRVRKGADKEQDVLIISHSESASSQHGSICGGAMKVTIDDDVLSPPPP